MLAQNIGDIENKLMKAFWPGPLTLILEKTEQVPIEITGGKTNSNNVAVRMPSSVIAQAIITYAGTPIAAPSANKSGKPSGTGIADIFDELKESVALFVDAGLPDIGVESTVVKVIDGMPTILRPGKITLEDIQDVVGHARLDDSVFSKIDDDTAPSSPGMKYRHYAPDCECQLIEIADNESKIAKVIEIVEQSSPNKIVVLCANENAQRYEHLENAYILPMGSYDNHDEISKSLFVNLRKAEACEPKLVLIESVKRKGLGLALMNRLIRACGYNIVDC
jgi:L-threonylcarbamoyladenylate synthase